MRALANLSKYYGCYDHWKSIKQKYDLKWTTGNDLDVFKAMVDDQHNYTAMVNWLKDTCSKIPKPYANILLFDVLTGLRPTEACQSIELFRSQAADKYLNNENMTLEHYKFPDIFIRTTKKAYISIVDERILALAKGTHHNGGYNSLRLKIKAAGLEMHMKYCRTIFSTYLRMHGIESELIDLLQGRIPRTVFARHYFRPDFDKDMKRIRKQLDRLQVQITAIEK